MTEDQLESEALSWLGELGYTHRHGADIAPDSAAPERSDYRQVLLRGRLSAAIHKLNPHIPASARDDALAQVLDLGIPALLSANRAFHKLLVGGVPVQYQKDGETRGDFVRGSRCGRYWHAEACVNGRRLHRRLPLGATASEAKRVEAELVRALGRVRQRQVAIPGDPRLTDLMAANFEHCKTLRHSISSKEHATAIGPWLEGRRAADARQVAAQIIKDMSPHYAPATINRRLDTLRKALRIAFDAG